MHVLLCHCIKLLMMLYFLWPKVYEMSNKIRFYFMVTWGIIAGKNHGSFFATFISKTWFLSTGSQSVMEPYQNSRWHHRCTIDKTFLLCETENVLYISKMVLNLLHVMLPHSIMDFSGTYWACTGHDISFCWIKLLAKNLSPFLQKRSSYWCAFVCEPKNEASPTFLPSIFFIIFLSVLPLKLWQNTTSQSHFSSLIG